MLIFRLFIKIKMFGMQWQEIGYKL